MMPWGHFLVAAVPFVGYTLVRHRTIPSGPVLLVLSLGTQFPDLVDKPLAWRFDLLLNGRMFMHSLVFAVPLSIAILLVAWKYDRVLLGGAFVFGHLLHIVGDFYSAIIGQQISVPRNMLWPLLPPRPLTKPEFVDQPRLLAFSTWDIVMIAGGAILVGYAFVATVSTVQRRGASG